VQNYVESIFVLGRYEKVRQSNEIADGYGKGDPLIYIQQELQKASELTDWGLEAGAR
jgi:hypothetical protein